MANDEHLARLKQGVGAWNQWRQENELIEIDLTGAILTEADLTGADLRRADLMGAILTGATLTGATLTRADLPQATLTRANLTGADLTEALLLRATLTGATLTRADLTEANLTGADLTRADLTRADLTRVRFCETTLGDTDLTNTRGLDSCRHLGPSTIDHRTIMRSWPLPLAFLRGCGLPDNLIDYLPALVNEPLEFYSCFISYSSSDQPFAERVYADLQNKGVRCWFAPEDMKIGDEFRSRIDQSIHLYERLLLIFSEHSIKSRWVQKEVETAFEKEIKENRLVLFPIRVDETVMDSTVGWAADIRRSRHIGNFTKWKDHDAYQQAFTRLLRDLKAEATEAQRKST